MILLIAARDKVSPLKSNPAVWLPLVILFTLITLTLVILRVCILMSPSILPPDNDNLLLIAGVI